MIRLLAEAEPVAIASGHDHAQQNGCGAGYWRKGRQIHEQIRSVQG
jgi:hypothetical protein